MLMPGSGAREKRDTQRAMSHENVEIVQATIDALNRGDVEAVIADAAPDFEFDFSRSIGPRRGVFGLDEVREFWDYFAGTFESVRIEPHEFIDAGEYVIVPWTAHMVGRDGIQVQARTTWTWTIREGAVVRLCMYQERAEALEAAGLSE
jgi:ketosteroid isomerase-like protein